MPPAKKSKKTKAKKATPKSTRATAKAKPRAIAKRQAAVTPKTLAKKRKTKPLAKSKVASKSKASTKKAATKSKAPSKVTAKTKPVSRAAAKSQSPKSKGRAPAAAQGRPPRRDAVGRLDPQYARDLRALSRENHDDHEDRAFFSSPRSGDDLAEELGEEAVSAMTSGEDQSERLSGGEVEEERGGPFVKTRAGDEFARGTDRSNPRDATREPFPRT